MPIQRRKSTFTPSTIDSGFILQLDSLPNPATSDSTFTRVLQWYLPQHVLQRVLPKLVKFGGEAVSEQINSYVANAELQQPFVKTRDLWGRKYSYDRLVTSDGWKKLGQWGSRNGVIAAGYEDEYGQYRRIVQHAFNYIYSASSAVYSCPVSMTSGAARLLQQQLPKIPSNHPFHEVYRRIIAREDNWISSQWMTERPGGSDVQNSETIAVYSPLSSEEKTGDTHFQDGDWLISGYKFFCSATDCDIALMLAKTEDSGQLSLFIAPTKRTVLRHDGTSVQVTNGIRFHRLKNKMGTRELPTAELELTDVRAWLVGPLDRGIATIATLLNVTRTHNFITALSCWRRGMAIAKNFARARETIDQPLWTFPLHLRLLASMEVKFRGFAQLAFFTTALLSFADNGFPSCHEINVSSDGNYAPLPEQGEQIIVVQRTLTAATKAVICKVACASLQECQEAMGGVGYMDEPTEPEFNISRLYRDTAANMTWEGTTNVLASEVVRHLGNDKNLDTFGGWFEGKMLYGIRDAEIKEVLMLQWTVVKKALSSAQTDLSSALADGRQIVFSLAWIVSGGLLAHDSQRDADPEALEVAKRWVLDADGGGRDFVLLDVLRATKGRKCHPLQQRQGDCRIVWGVDLPSNAAAGYRVPTVKSTGKPEQVASKL